MSTRRGAGEVAGAPSASCGSRVNCRDREGHGASPWMWIDSGDDDGGGSEENAATLCLLVARMRALVSLSFVVLLSACAAPAAPPEEDGPAVDAGEDTHDAGDTCVPKTCEELAVNGITRCGLVHDGCDDELDCGGCQAPQSCDDAYCYCQAETDGELCGAQGLVCGTLEVTDRCLEKRTLECSCPSGMVCDAAAKTCEGLTDERDGRTYKITRIGDQVWMAENLGYAAEDSLCWRGGLPEPGEECPLGRYYMSSTARAGASGSSADPSGVQGVCPPGWHLPSYAEFERLIATIVAEHGVGEGTESEPHVEAHLKKSINSFEWDEDSAFDSYGFGLIPMGVKMGADSMPYGSGQAAYLWSASEDEEGRDWWFVAREGVGVLGAEANHTYWGASVRCVRD